MLKKSTLALSTVGVLSLASAHHISPCDFEVGNCTGFYYNDINAAFLDCFDANGVIISRKEAFYTSPLVSECNSTSWESFQESLGNSSSVAAPANSTSNSTVNYCDYYLYGEGYQFTQAEFGIGLVLLQDRYNTTNDLYYKEVSAPLAVPAPSTPTLSWNWSELTQLVQALTNSQCA